MLRLPRRQVKRGRPKGAGLTVIGLLNKKNKFAKGPLAYKLKSETEKHKGNCV